jgi:hypothetical protein
MKGARLFQGLMLSMVAACDSRTVSPSSVPTPAPTSKITVRSIAPASGATLPVRECPYYPSSLNLNFWEMCADQLQMSFDVEFERDVTNAVVTAGFYSGAQRCGLATSQSAPLQAGSRASFETKVILLSDEVNRLLCALPAETTRMVVQLWERDRPATPLLTEEFSHTYRFAEQ